MQLRSRRHRLALALALMASLCSGCSGTPRRPTRSPYEVVLPEVKGGRLDLAHLKGRVVLVYFFATWCFPCLVEMKTLIALQNEAEARGFTVVAVGMDLEGRKVLQPFVDTYRPPFAVLLADEEVRSGQSPFGRVEALPTTFLIDREGRVDVAYEGPADPLQLQRRIDQLLGR
ncbi:MAG: TlpA family protein disulfide reductase [Deltaproteobacteria bacterium]|nr:TlpA family protein disulfide reductase [Deltaproteobacteria bacterium]